MVEQQDVIMKSVELKNFQTEVHLQCIRSHPNAPQCGLASMPRVQPHRSHVKNASTSQGMPKHFVEVCDG